MSEPYFVNPPEMEKFLTKYRSGNVPPLVSRANGGDGGLINEGLLEILRKGFSVKYSIPRIFISSEIHAKAKSEGQIETGEEFHIPGFAPNPPEDMSDRQLRDLFASCKLCQSFLESDTEEANGQENEDIVSSAANAELLENEPHEGCSIRRSMIMKNRRARVCLCYCGMLSFFIPVYVAGEIIAFLFTECKKPKAGTIWPRQLVEQVLDGVPSFSSDGIDLWKESERRIRRCEEKLDIKSGELLKAAIERAKIDPEIEVSPDDSEAIISSLEDAAGHLSSLAEANYKLEKESIIGWMRAEMASALSSPDDFWDKIQWCLGNLAQLVGSDYILLISRGKSDANNNNGLQLQCQYGLPQESLPALQYKWAGSASHVDKFIKAIGTFRDFQEIDLREYRDVPVMGVLYSLYGKGVSYPVSVVTTTTMDGVPTFMILGKQMPGEYASGWLREDDHQYLKTIVRELAIITNVFFSMLKLQETRENHTNFMESVSHDLRTPIQNIMIAAENLRERRIPPERASRTITGVVTQLERLNLLAQKAWMLEQIRVDNLVYNDEQTVNPYTLSLECRDLLIDLAEGKDINIRIDPDMKNWRDIRVDVEMFRLVVLNLLHNGIKYSFPSTHIKVGGWQDGMGIGVAMTFENEGIYIRDEEREQIFERYFRSKDAIRTDPAGSGVGLALVKEFVEHYKGKIDVRSTEVGFGRYLNVFSLFLPGR